MRTRSVTGGSERLPDKRTPQTSKKYMHLPTAPRPPAIMWTRAGTQAYTHQSEAVLKDGGSAQYAVGMCPNITRAAQERDYGEIFFRTVTGVIHTRVECLALSEHATTKIGENEADDEVQGDLLDELAARRRRMWG